MNATPHPGGVHLPPLQDERVERVRELLDQMGPNTDAPSPTEYDRGWLDAVACMRQALSPAQAALSEERTQVSDAPAQADAASLPLVGERLRELREKAHKGPWARWEKDGSGWDDYAHELHGRVQSETHDIADFFHDEDRDFVVALVDWFDTLTATKPSGQVERAVVAMRLAAAEIERDVRLAELTADEWQSLALAALSPQSQPAAQSESHTA